MKSLRCLVATIFLAGEIIFAADGGLKAVYPGAKPVCECEELRKVELANTSVEAAEVRDGACWVTAVVTHPPAGDRVKVWVALPLANWNGRFRGTGGGGFLGGGTNSLRGPVMAGFATGATDTGHDGGSGSFALDGNGRLDWQRVIDFAYLGIHEMTVVGKALTEKFYGKAPRYSYFVGQSTGGRQGITEAERYPGDYDGIVSACPAINWHRFLPSDIWAQAVMNELGNYVSKAKLDAVTAAAVEVCDGAGELKNGVIEDPFKCGFEAKSFVGRKVGEEIFSEKDAEVVRRIWAGPRGIDGSFMWHGVERGADLSALAATGGSPLSGRPFSIANDWVRFFLKQDRNWDASKLGVAEFALLWKQSVEQYGIIFGNDRADLTGFRESGGKLIIYHGLTDQLIPAAGTIDYYKRLQERMGGAEKTAEFARLFLAPGVDHGFRGAGLTPSGQFEAIVKWVEEGVAPEELAAEKRDRDGKAVGRGALKKF